MTFMVRRARRGPRVIGRSPSGFDGITSSFCHRRSCHVAYRNGPQAR